MDSVTFLEDYVLFATVVSSHFTLCPFPQLRCSRACVALRKEAIVQYNLFVTLVFSIIVNTIVLQQPFLSNFCKSQGATNERYEHFGVRAHLRGEHLTLPLSGRVADGPAAMGSRWRFVVHNPLSLCCPGHSTWPTTAGHTWYSAQAIV